MLAPRPFNQHVQRDALIHICGRCRLGSDRIGCKVVRVQSVSARLVLSNRLLPRWGVASVMLHHRVMAVLKVFLAELLVHCWYLDLRSPTFSHSLKTLPSVP